MNVDPFSRERVFMSILFCAFYKKNDQRGIWVVDDLRFPEGLKRQNGMGPFVDRKRISALMKPW